MDDWKPDQEVLEDLIVRLKADSTDLDAELIYFPGLEKGEYSTNQVIQEIYKGTPLGRGLYELHVKVMKDIEKLSKEKKEKTKSVSHIGVY